MALPSAVVEHTTNKALSVFSTKLDHKASRRDTIARIEIAVHRIDRVLEKTGKIAITDVSLLRIWNSLKQRYMEGMALLNKYRPQQELDGQVVVRSPSYFHRFAANLSISSLVGLVNQPLSPSDARAFERYAAWAEKFVTEVESSCPLRRDTLDYPFLRHLFQGKTLWYAKEKGSKQYGFFIWPVILEGRGVEAMLVYESFDPERLHKSFFMYLMLRISESTDIVGSAINCLRSSASLLNPVSQDAAGELTLLHNLQDIVYSYEPPSVQIQQLYPGWTKRSRSDPLCCRQEANGHEPSINSIISSELSQIFPEQIIEFGFQCYHPMLKCSLASASDKAHGNAMVDLRGGPHPPVITYAFLPHKLSPCMLEANSTVSLMVTKKEGHGGDTTPGNSSNIKDSIDEARLAVINHLTDEPEVMDIEVEWTTKHGAVRLNVEKTPEDILTAVKASRRYNTRSAKKRKM